MMRNTLVHREALPKSIPIYGVSRESFSKNINALGREAKSWCEFHNFTAKPNQYIVIPASKQNQMAVYVGLDETPSLEPFALGSTISILPPNRYYLDDSIPNQEKVALGFALSTYKYEKYTPSYKIKSVLEVSPGVDLQKVCIILDGIQIARDLINSPANVLGPVALADEIEKLFSKHGGTGNIIVGEELIERNLELVHCVGRASSQQPRLADFCWGDAYNPKVTLVGKGVTFDSGGLDLKPGFSMALMKKDMGGAANVLGLAHMIMEAQLPVRLRVIIPCVENAISGDAYRPGDILCSRNGLQIEVANTDAEGRLALADVLALADEESPELLIDMATLTGEARAALGPDIPAFFTSDDILADQIRDSAEAISDPVWRLPLWYPYIRYLETDAASIKNFNTESNGFAGSIIAALFLSKFIERARSWVHFDIYAWSPTIKPGSSLGGEAQGIRCLFEVISERYGGDQ